MRNVQPAIVLTERQREVLALVRRGQSNREIGDELGISEDGVKAHLSRLYLRFGVTNRVELLNVVNEGDDADPDLTRRAPLGTLRAIAGRADVRTERLRTASPARAAAAHLAVARKALAAVDVSLDLVSELPPETSGAVIDVVRRRLATALAAIDQLEGIDAPGTG